MDGKKLVAGLLTSSLLMSMTTGCAKKKIQEPSEMQTVNSPSEQTAIFELTTAGLDGKTHDEKFKLREQYGEFVFGLLRKTLQSANGENVLISPDSILFSLEMAAAGANGETLDQMMNTMVPGASNDDAFACITDRSSMLQKDHLTIANSAWINQENAGSVYGDYLSFVKENFNAEIQTVKFNTSAANTINDWVSRKTDGLIDRLIDKVDPEAKMYLVNTIGFNDEWASKFKEEKIEEGEFKNQDGSKTTVTFLNDEFEAKYIFNDRAQGFIKPYLKSGYAFVAILPNDENADINEFMAEMTIDEFYDLISSSFKGNNRVIYKLPEFECSYSTSLKDTLKDMGMPLAFDKDHADFSNIGTMPLCIEDVVQKTYIKVDRNGTAAGAASRSGISTGAGKEPPKIQYVMCDRPFAYAIVDSKTCLPVFIGTVANL